MTAAEKRAFVKRMAAGRAKAKPAKKRKQKNAEVVGYYATPDQSGRRYGWTVRREVRGITGAKIDGGVAHRVPSQQHAVAKARWLNEKLQKEKSKPAASPKASRKKPAKESAQLGLFNPKGPRQANPTPVDPDQRLIDLHRQGFMKRKPGKTVTKYEVVSPDEGLVYHGSYKHEAESAAKKYGGKVKAIKVRENPKAPNGSLWFADRATRDAAAKLLRARGVKPVGLWADLNRSGSGKPKYFLTGPASNEELESALLSQRNPQSTAEERAKDLYESFHGRPPHRVIEYEQPDERPEAYTDLGKLLQLFVFIGEDAAATKIDGFGSARLTAAPPDPKEPADSSTLYFVGGNQALDLPALGFASELPKHHIELGKLAAIEYHSRKGFHDFEPIDYTHRFGIGAEDQPDRAPFKRFPGQPTLLYDVKNKLLYLAGGRYKVKPEGIVN